jgi:hypothetical protein
MKPPNLTTPEGRAAALEAEKHVFRIRRQAREDVEREPRTKPPTLIGYTLEELIRHKFPPRRTVLARGDHTWIRAGNIWQIFAYRGIGKTWLLETLALVAAYQIETLGLRAPGPSRVLYVDGEMASEDVKERFELLCKLLGVSRQLGLLAQNNLTIVGADWQEEYLPRLDTLEGQAAVEPFVEAAELIMLDGRSSLLDPEGEKDPTAWQPAQDWLLSLRKRGKSVVMAHQANRQGGSRGHGKAEDAIDVNLKLSRPEGYTADRGARFLVEFDKARGVHGPAAESFIATLVDTEGWVVEDPKRQEEAEESEDRAALDAVVLETLAKHAVTDKEKLAMMLNRRAGDVRDSLGRLLLQKLVDQGGRRKPFVVTADGLAWIEKRKPEDM